MGWVQIVLTAMRIGWEVYKYAREDQFRKDTKDIKHRVIRDKIKGDKGVKISKLFNDIDP